MADFKHESWAKYQLVYCTSWWDWELAGICKRDGKRYFFACTNSGWEPNPAPEDEFDTSIEYRIFALYDPPADVWAKIDERHEDFCRWVGDHWDFEPDENGVTGRQRHELRPYETHHLFYDKYKDEMTDSAMMLPEWQVGIADSRIPA